MLPGNHVCVALVDNLVLRILLVKSIYKMGFV